MNHRPLAAVLAAAAGALLALPQGAAAQNQFDPQVVHQLCAKAFDFGKLGNPPEPGWDHFLGGSSYNPSGTNVIDAWPNWTPSDPGNETVVRVKLRRSGVWRVEAVDETPGGPADVFV